MSDPTPPGHLSRPAKKLWRTVIRDYQLDAHHLEMLSAALQAWDRMNEARELLAAEGVTYVDRFGAPRKHPAVSIEENARTAFLRALRELDLDGEPLPDPRLPRRG
jgi:P27 family predicted phage terminase small subunit